MRYNSSDVFDGYTAGGIGSYKYRMYVDGDDAFCIQPGVPLGTGNTLKKNSSETWNAFSSSQKKAVGLALFYGYQGNRSHLSGSDDEKWLATQTLVWEFVTGCRESTGSYQQTSQKAYSLHFGSNYPNSGAAEVYNQIVCLLFMLIYLKKKKLFTFKISTFNCNDVLPLIQKAIPSVIQQSIPAISTTSLTALVSTYSVTAIAAYGVTGKLETILFYPAMALNMVLTTIIGQCAGGARYDRAKDYLKCALFLQYSSYFSHCRKGLTAFAVFCLSIFVGKRDKPSSGIGCRSPSFPI